MRRNLSFAKAGGEYMAGKKSNQYPETLKSPLLLAKTVIFSTFV